MTTSTTVRSATESQLGFISDLEAKREVPAWFMPLRSTLTVRTASDLINALKALPFKRTNRTSGSFVPSSDVAGLEEGTYTVASNHGHEWVTLRLRRESWCDGKMVISYLYGSDNDYSYKAFGFVTPTGVRPFQAFRGNTRLLEAAQTLLVTPLTTAREAFLQQAETYALASGRCLNCLHTLTVPASLHRGLGPVCARNLGVS